MSRYNDTVNTQPILAASARWAKLALGAGMSVFSDQPIWRLEHIRSLETYFSNNLDTGEGDFFDKLEVQLATCAPEVKQLAAEMLWLMLLCPSNIGAAKKRESVLRVWAWSGSTLAVDHELLSDQVLVGVGSGGTSFNTNRWRELAYCIAICKAAFQLDPEVRQALFADWNTLIDWMEKIPDNGRRQLRHMLLYLLHPDQSERVFSSGDRKLIAVHFSGKSSKFVNQLSPAEIDRLLLQIRQEQEAEFSSIELDFYVPPLRELWKDRESRSWLFAWNPKKWAWEDLPEVIAQTCNGKPVVMRWSCVNQEVMTGDRAWLVRLGVEPKGIMGCGNVISDPYEAEHYDESLAQEGKTCLFVDVELTDIRDVYKDAYISMQELGSITIDKQQWSPQSSGIEIKSRSAALLDKLWQAKAKASNSMSGAVQPALQIAEATNKILYGPPGTGKTYRLDQLKQRYVVKQSAISLEQWLSERLKPLSWFEVIFMCLHDLGGSAMVKDIEEHPYFVQKAKAVGRQLSLKAQIWASLQAHTVESSTTVGYKNRTAPLVFDKDSHSRWRMAGNWQEEGEDLLSSLQRLKQGPEQKAEQVHYAFVTFHQSYSYEDFVEGIRPVQDADTDQLVYKVEPGIFRQICQDAKNAPQTRFALFVDEINRGNVAKIFGELITLIEPDKRAVYDADGNLLSGMELTLPYSRERFGVPNNLDIFGTMNTADRSIALLDTALRRRFRFEELMPTSKVISGSRGDGYIEDGEGGLIDLRALLDAINLRIRFMLNRDLTLGHAYFFGVKDFHGLRRGLLDQVIPLLQEYFYSDWHRIQLVFRDVDQSGQPIKPQIIEHKQLTAVEVLGFEHDDFEQIIDYKVAEPTCITPEAIRKIYEVQG